MLCIPVEIPESITQIDDELKAIYHSSDSICIFVFNSRIDRNQFMERSIGMLKDERMALYTDYQNQQNKK